MLKPTTKRFTWQPLDPGQLRNQVTLGTLSTSQDASGQPLSTWPVYLTCYASIRQLSGQELYQADEFTSAKQVKIVMRWPGPGITINPGDRVFFGTHVYVIEIVDNVEMRNIQIELTCLEIDGTN